MPDCHWALSCIETADSCGQNSTRYEHASGGATGWEAGFWSVRNEVIGVIAIDVLARISGAWILACARTTK